MYLSISHGKNYLFICLEVSRNIDSLVTLSELGDVLKVLGQFAVGSDDGAGNNWAHLLLLVLLEGLQQN
jgi:hypothetical protein